jgi:hypothetical protein
MGMTLDELNRTVSRLPKEGFAELMRCLRMFVDGHSMTVEALRAVQVFCRLGLLDLTRNAMSSEDTQEHAIPDPDATPPITTFSVKYPRMTSTVLGEK